MTTDKPSAAMEAVFDAIAPRTSSRLDEGPIRPDFIWAYLDFIQGSMHNAWLENRVFSLYLRKTQRRSDYSNLEACSLEQALDVANLSVNEKFRGKGVLTAVMDYIEKNCPCRQIYVENIIGIDEASGARLLRFFVEKRGYTIIPPPCFTAIAHNELLPCAVKFLW